MSDPAAIADVSAAVVARDYKSLMAAIVTRKRELRLSGLEIDDLAGLPDGYFNKITCGTRGFGMRSIGPVLDALNLELIVRPASLSRPKDKCFSSQNLGVPNYKKNKILSSRGQIGGQKGGRRAWTLMTEAQRRKKMQKMWKARSAVARARARARSKAEAATDRFLKQERIS